MMEAIEIEDLLSETWRRDMVWTVTLAAFANASGAKDELHSTCEVYHISCKCETHH